MSLPSLVALWTQSILCSLQRILFSWNPNGVYRKKRTKGDAFTSRMAEERRRAQTERIQSANCCTEGCNDRTQNHVDFVQIKIKRQEARSVTEQHVKPIHDLKAQRDQCWFRGGRAACLCLIHRWWNRSGIVRVSSVRLVLSGAERATLLRGTRYDDQNLN